MASDPIALRFLERVASSISKRSVLGDIAEAHLAAGDLAVFNHRHSRE